MINQIWENASNVKSAIRMAQDEVDKITGLKTKVDEETLKVNKSKEEEKQKQATIIKLKAQIEELEEQAKQQNELDEDRQLKLLDN